MKTHFTLVSLAALLLASAGPNARAQSNSVTFGNNGSSRLFNGQSGLPVTSADGIQVALYWAPVGSMAFIQLGAAVNAGVPLAGLFAGGTRTLSISGGNTAQFRVKAWGGGYATYEQAAQQQGVNVGQSAIITMATGSPRGSPPTPPASLTANGLQSFNIGLPPNITSSPTNQLVSVGTNVAFIVTATSLVPLSYQWRFNGTNLADGARLTGSLSNVLTLSSAQLSDSGSYQAVVSNAYGAVTTLAATLSIATPPRLLQFTLTNRVATLVWSTSPGFSYQTQFKTNLAQLDWSDLGQTIVAISNSAFLADTSATSSQRFYRVLLLPAP